MALFSSWISMKRGVAAEATKRYWLFYAGPENYLFEGGVRELPQEAFWSCEPETKLGDLILVYRKSMSNLSVDHLVRTFGMPESVAKRSKKMGVGKDFPVVWEATSNAQRKLLWQWPYGCETREIQRISPPLLLADLKAERQLKKWDGLRWNLQAQGRSALEIPEYAWEVIANMIENALSRQRSSHGGDVEP